MGAEDKNEIQVLASAARTATTTAKFSLPYGRGLVLIVDITARAAATTVTPKLSISGAWSTTLIDFWTAAAALNSANTTVAYLLYPGAGSASPAGFTEEVDKAIPPNITLTMTHSDANSLTYSVHVIELT